MKQTLDKIFISFIIILLNCCNKDTIEIDPCSELVHGYVIGIHQCALTTGFIVTTIDSADTLETFNLPDSLYHLFSEHDGKSKNIASINPVCVVEKELKK